MTVARLALVAILAAMVAAEISRPTTFHAKRVVGSSVLDRTELEDLPPIVQPALGNIDATYAIAHGSTRVLGPDGDVPSDATIRLVGWCADPESRLPGTELLAIVDGRERTDVTRGYRVQRPDVATYYADPALSPTGFTAEVSVASLAPGDHTVQMAVVTSDRSSVAYFPTIVRFRVRANAR